MSRRKIKLVLIFQDILRDVHRGPPTLGESSPAPRLLAFFRREVCGEVQRGDLAAPRALKTRQCNPGFNYLGKNIFILIICMGSTK